MTDSCTETCSKDCNHVEHGCINCGDCGEVHDDDGYCGKCSFDRACLAADLIYDRIKEGD